MQSLCVPHRGLFSLLVSILCQALRRSYVHEVTAEVSLAEQLLFKACGGNERIGIDAGAIAHAVEHKHAGRKQTERGMHRVILFVQDLTKYSL